MTLDEAWKEAEAALPEGWVIRAVERHWPPEGSWMAWAHRYNIVRSGTGPTPAAALQELAASLRLRTGEPTR
jgi:hypothetical protein